MSGSRNTRGLHQTLTLNLRNPSESSILQAFSVPPLLATVLKKMSIEQHVAFAIRAGNPFRSKLNTAPKPSYVGEKITDWGPMRGAVPVDPRLNRIEYQFNGSLSPKVRSTKDFPAYQLPSIVHSISLREIMTSIHFKEYKFVYQSGFLIFEATINVPDENKMLFRINLANPIDTPIASENNNRTILKPVWWPRKLINFTHRLDCIYTIQYKHVSEKEFYNLEVYGIKNKNNVVIPFSGDQDLLWMTTSITQNNPSGKPAMYLAIKTNQGIEKLFLYPYYPEFKFTKAINTFHVHQSTNVIPHADFFNENMYEGTKMMMTRRIELEKWLLENTTNRMITNNEITTIVKTVSMEMISILGCMTPLESRMMSCINKAITTDDADIYNHFQHGCENRNPKTPSPIDAPMLHFWEGKIFLTKNEDGLINFTLQTGYLETNLLHIHPLWNMSKWHRVIEKQIALHHPIANETKEAYQAYKQKHLSCISGAAEPVKVILHAFAPSKPVPDVPLPSPIQSVRRLRLKKKNIVSAKSLSPLSSTRLLPANFSDLEKQVASRLPLLFSSKNNSDDRDIPEYRKKCVINKHMWHGRPTPPCKGKASSDRLHLRRLTININLDH